MPNMLHVHEVECAFSDFIMVNRTLVKFFKDANPALLLGYFISEYKYLRENKKLDQYGYFYCKVDKLEEKFGFSSKVQARLFNILIDFEMVEVVNKRIEGVTLLSSVRHIKVFHSNIYNLIIGNTNESKPLTVYPGDYHNIHPFFHAFVKSKRGKFVETANDNIIYKIATAHGLTPEILQQTIDQKYKLIKGKQVTPKYLLKAFIPDISKWEAKYLNIELKNGAEREKRVSSILIS